MATEIPDLWGNDIDVDVVPPLVILKTRAEAISRRTKGMLRGDVSTDQREEGNGKIGQTYAMLLQAPSIGYYGEPLFELSHADGRFYPARIELPVDIKWRGVERPMRWRVCNDQEELMTALSDALTSPPTKAALNSLLARVNERQIAKKQPVTPPAGT